MKKIFYLSFLLFFAAITLSCKKEILMGDKSPFLFSETNVVMKSQKEDTVLVTSNIPSVLMYAQNAPLDITVHPNATLDTIYAGWLKVVMHDTEIKLITMEDNDSGVERVYGILIGTAAAGAITVTQQPAQ